MAEQFQFGLDTFGDVTIGGDGRLQPHAQVIRDLIDEAVLADALGVNAFGVGEHHRPDFAVSAPEVVLAAIAARTKQIHLGSAVTVLSTDDPIRVFERFSTINAVSSGRAEITLGRGSFTESFPLFGYDLSQYEVLFEEKVDLFAALVKSNPVTWEGRLRPPLKDQHVYPPIETGALKTWIGVGGSPESVVRAAHYDFPLALAIIGGDPKRFKPYVDLYHRAFTQFGRPRERDRRAFARAYRRDRRAGAGGIFSRLQGDARQDRRRTRLAADVPRRSSSRKSSAARSTSARRKLSRARSPRPRRRSGSRASISNTAPAHCRMAR